MCIGIFQKVALLKISGIFFQTGSVGLQSSGYKPSKNGLQTKILKSALKILEKFQEELCNKILFSKPANVLTRSLQLSCSKTGKLLGRPTSILRKDSIVDVLLRHFQKFWEQLFFRNTNGCLLPKIHAAFFPGAPTGSSGWINRKLKINE